MKTENDESLQPISARQFDFETLNQNSVDAKKIKSSLVLDSLERTILQNDDNLADANISLKDFERGNISLATLDDLKDVFSDDSSDSSVSENYLNLQKRMTKKEQELENAVKMFKLDRTLLDEALTENNLLFLSYKESNEQIYRVHREIYNRILNRDIYPIKVVPKKSLLTILMIGGGQFAGMILDISASDKSRGCDYTIIKWKTFHRYTTRRKQGGSQANADSSRAGIYSAGSSLRRYNEKALETEVRELLSAWSGEIQESDLILYRCAGSNNKKIFFDYDNAPLLANKSKTLKIPFTTYKATKTELLRCIDELLYLQKCTSVEALIILYRTATKLAIKQKKAIIEANIAQSLEASRSQFKTQSTSDDRNSIEISLNLLAQHIKKLIKRNKVPALMNLLQQHCVDINESSLSLGGKCPITMLHVAAMNESNAIILALLENGADPTIMSGSNELAYDLCDSNSSKDIFRLARFNLGEQKYNWNKAHVESALSQAEVFNREKAAQLEIEQQAAKLLKQESIENSNKAKNEKGILPSKIRNAGLSEEMIKRIDREKRAAAAMARLKLTK